MLRTQRHEVLRTQRLRGAEDAASRGAEDAASRGAEDAASRGAEDAASRGERATSSEGGRPPGRSILGAMPLKRRARRSAQARGEYGRENRARSEAQMLKSVNCI